MATSANVLCAVMPRRMLAAASLAWALAAPTAVRAEVFGNSFRSAEWGAELSVPRSWELSEQRSYPGIILRGFEHATGARLTLAAERVGPAETLTTYVERNQKTLVRLGYRVTGVVRRDEHLLVLDSTPPDHQHALRQAYLVGGGVAYVFSVAVRSEGPRAGRSLEVFDEALKTLTLSPPPAPAPAPAAPPAETSRP